MDILTIYTDACVYIHIFRYMLENRCTCTMSSEISAHVHISIISHEETGVNTSIYTLIKIGCLLYIYESWFWRKQHPIWGHVGVHIFNRPIIDEPTFKNRVQAKNCCSIGQYNLLSCFWLDGKIWMKCYLTLFQMGYCSMLVHCQNVKKKIQQISHFNDIPVIVFSKNVYLRIWHNNSCFQF